MCALSNVHNSLYGSWQASRQVLDFSALFVLEKRQFKHILISPILVGTLLAYD